MKKIRVYLKITSYSLLVIFCFLSQSRTPKTTSKYLPLQIQVFDSVAAGNTAWLDKSVVPHLSTAAPSLAKYIQKRFSAPEVTEAFIHPNMVELEKTADGIKLKAGYLGSSKPQAALKPEEMKALAAMAARDNFKEYGLPVFTLGNSLGAGYTIKYNGNVLKVRHVLKSGKPSEAVIEGGEVVYSDTHRDTSILYVMSPGRCQEMLLLKSAKAPKEFEYEYSKEISLNEKGEIIVDGLALSRPVIFDAAGKRVNGFYRKITKSRVQLAFNGAGLRYPLLIDPTWKVSAGSMIAARSGHTTTLLPNGKVLVAGGYNNGFLSSAELYDPSAGTFSATGSMSAARGSHTATLLPTGKVLVVGGDAGGALSSAELYDPGLGTFSTTGLMSVARWSHTATLLPTGKVLIVGGSNSSEVISSAELYDPSLGTFSVTGSMSVARVYNTATLLSTGKVLVAGGVNSSESLSSAELYDPASGTFSATGSLTAARQIYTATLLPNGKVLLAGGYGGGSVYSSSSELYDPDLGTFSATGSMNAARCAHAAILLPTGKVLVVGGYNNGFLSSSELYDPSAGTFAATDSMNVARQNHTATLLPNGKVLIAGGFGTGNISLPSAELYIPSGGSGTFSATGSMSAIRSGYTATLLPNGNVLVAGGYNGAYYLSWAELYNPLAGTFSITGSMSAARYAHTATLLPSGKVLIAGGYDGNTALSSAELYDPSIGTFSATGSMSAMRWFPAAVLLPNGKVLVVGGMNAGVVAELFDPATGTFSTTGSISISRVSPTATLLPNGKVLVVSGEGPDEYHSSAELYDPSVGTFSTTGLTNGKRYWHAAVLLPSGKVLVTGGTGFIFDGGTAYSSAELYDPSAGTFSNTGSMAEVRGYPSAILLPNGKVLIAGSTSSVTSELYDPLAGTFSLTGSMLMARRYYGDITLLPNGKILIAGGYDGNTALSSAELYDTLWGFLTGLNPSLSSVSSSGMTASWTSIPGASYVAVLASDSGYNNIISSSTVGSNLKVFGSLSPNTSYYFEVKLSTETDDSFALNRISTATLPPATNLNPHISQLNIDGFSVVWDNVGGASYTTVVSTNSNFVPVTSSGSLSLNTTSYSGLPASTTYYFEVKLTTETDAAFALNLISTLPNRAPTLAWTGESNYAVDGINPQAGYITTNFIYRVKYTDADNDALGNGYPKLHIKKAGSEIAGSPFTMTFVSGTYSSGAIYTYTKTLTSGLDYSYYFEAQDANGANSTGAPAAAVDAPDVAEIPRQGDYKTTLGDNLFNPRTGGVAKIKFNLPSAGRVSLKIYDLSGRLIRILFDGESGLGDFQKDWDGKDDSGRYVVPDVYLLHYTYPGGKEVRKIGVKK